MDQLKTFWYLSHMPKASFKWPSWRINRGYIRRGSRKFCQGMGSKNLDFFCSSHHFYRGVRTNIRSWPPSASQRNTILMSLCWSVDDVGIFQGGGAGGGGGYGLSIPHPSLDPRMYMPRFWSQSSSSFSSIVLCMRAAKALAFHICAFWNSMRGSREGGQELAPPPP